MVIKNLKLPELLIRCPPRKLSKECLTAFINEGWNQNQIAKACGLSRQAVNYRFNPKRKRKGRSEKKQAKLLSIWFLRHWGYTWLEISKMLGYKGTGAAWLGYKSLIESYSYKEPAIRKYKK